MSSMSEASEPRWFIARDKKKLGPYAVAELQGLAADGQFHPEDMVLLAGAKKWVAADSIPALVFSQCNRDLVGVSSQGPMPIQCPACSKVNPLDAVYCYYDGRALAQGSQQGPLRLGTLPFPMPFCFADGESCTNFNQLGLVCDERWDEARNLLAEGIWQSFFSALGRLDLAAAAKQAAAQPDLDVGLSQLLENLPTDPGVLRPPKLAVLSAEQDLGDLAPGKDRTFELHVTNQGLLMLRGMVTSDCEWLSFGEPARGPALRVFQTRASYTLTVRVLGNKLRAGRKPLEGTIVVDTNGGTITLLVRAHVPIRPFPTGMHGNDVLAGATSPHELAVKAKAHPREAAVLFEQGAVRAWYASNGWTYPIQDTEGTGKGAVQQFFEALGLTKPPRLEISTQQVLCQGKAGQRLTQHVTISTREAKPVYANAWSNQDWLKPGLGKPRGSKVKIPLQIEVPPRPGETLHANVMFQGNGNQQFVVPVTLAVAAAGACVAEAESSGGLRLGWLLAGITVMVLIAAVVIGKIWRDGRDDMGPPIAGNGVPKEQPVQPVSPVQPVPQVPQVPPPNEAWWKKFPNAKLTASLAELKDLVPQEKAIFEGIAAPSDVERYKAYEKLETKLPELMRNPKARDPLGRLIADCCVFEPSKLNMSPLRRALTSQVPRKGAAFRPEDKGDELTRGIWSLQVAFSALTNPAIRPERAKSLANHLGTVFGFDLDTDAPPEELKAQTEKSLAERCYRNMLPTAARSIGHALAMRGSLLKEFPEHLSPTFREKADPALRDLEKKLDTLENELEFRKMVAQGDEALKRKDFAAAATDYQRAVALGFEEKKTKPTLDAIQRIVNAKSHVQRAREHLEKKEIGEALAQATKVKDLRAAIEQDARFKDTAEKLGADTLEVLVGMAKVLRLSSQAQKKKGDQLFGDKSYAAAEQEYRAALKPLHQASELLATFGAVDRDKKLVDIDIKSLQREADKSKGMAAHQRGKELAGKGRDLEKEARKKKDGSLLVAAQDKFKQAVESFEASLAVPGILAKTNLQDAKENLDRIIGILQPIDLDFAKERDLKGWGPLPKNWLRRNNRLQTDLETPTGAFSSPMLDLPTDFKLRLQFCLVDDAGEVRNNAWKSYKDLLSIELVTRGMKNLVISIGKEHGAVQLATALTVEKQSKYLDLEGAKGPILLVLSRRQDDVAIAVGRTIANAPSPGEIQSIIFRVRNGAAPNNKDLRYFPALMSIALSLEKSDK